MFHLLLEGDILNISSSPWIIGHGVLMLKRWKHGFNPYMESFSKCFVWMLFPKFPIELWVTQIFIDLENIMGRFVYFDEKTLCWKNKRIAWVLVEFDSEKGFRRI